MDFIRRKLFIISYLGNLLLILATFVPIIKFNNQSFAFIDQFFYLSFAVVILATVSLVFVTLKKYKISVAPTIINAGIIAYGIYDIFHIDGLNLMDTSKGIAFFLYPIGAILAIIASLFAINEKNEAKPIKQKMETIVNDAAIINEINDTIIDNDINTNYEEQIPLDNILNKNIDSESIESIVDNSMQDTDYSNMNSNINIYNDNTSDNDNNDIEFDEFKFVDNNENITTENNNMIDASDDEFIGEEYLLEEIEEIPTEQLIENANNFSNDDDKLFMDDIDDEIKPQEIINPNIDEIPDIDDDSIDIMKNNTQIEDAPKKEFMALNPSDIKINEKKNLFKKKEKKEEIEDPLTKILNRDIPMTLGRKCNFCETPLGDDERICPMCGRIN